MLEQYQAYLLIRMDQTQAEYGITQLARDLSRWTRALVRLPGRSRRA